MWMLSSVASIKASIYYNNKVTSITELECKAIIDYLHTIIRHGVLEDICTAEEQWLSYRRKEGKSLE